MSALVGVIWVLLVVLGVGFVGQWWAIVRQQRTEAGAEGAGATPSAPPGALYTIGFVTNLFDTLGIGSFATTTAAYRLGGLVPDEDIPGTLNVGHTLPVITQAVIFIAAVKVEPVTLIAMIISATLGARIGAGIVARLPRRTIQWAMGAALLIAAAVILGRSLHLLPGGGDLLGLTGATLALAVAGNFVLGSLNMVGIGLYAPCLTLVSLLGMNPVAAFPIMMGSCAFLMPIGSLPFVRARRYDRRAAIGLAVGGIPAVLIAAFFIKSLPLTVLNWLVFAVVLYTSATLLWSAWRTPAAAAAAATVT